MQLFDVLSAEREFFVLDDIEDKKTKSLIKQINEQISNVLKKAEEFKVFAESQIQGEYNRKIIMAKSLKAVYSNWVAINNVCNALKREEDNLINSFLNSKKLLIDNLKALLLNAKKFPVISAYDVFNGGFALSKKGHSVIILGNHNTAIIETLINELEEKLIVEGNYDNVKEVELSVSYASVEKNANECRKVVDEYFYNKHGKEEKLLGMVDSMEVYGKQLVLFATYKNDMLNVGCNSKEVDLFEKDLFKKYVPLKKQLSKLLKVNFVDICDLSHDEGDYPTQEFKAIDDEE